MIKYRQDCTSTAARGDLACSTTERAVGRRCAVMLTFFDREGRRGVPGVAGGRGGREGGEGEVCLEGGEMATKGHALDVCAVQGARNLLFCQENPRNCLLVPTAGGSRARTLEKDNMMGWLKLKRCRPDPGPGIDVHAYSSPKKLIEFNQDVLFRCDGRSAK